MTAPPYVRLRNSTDPLPNPERDYVRITVMNTAANSPHVPLPVATFAVHNRIARQCKLLDAMLDELDLVEGDLTSPSGVEGAATVPDVDTEGCVAVFEYLELTSTRVPTLIARPLRAPLTELVQPWEMQFLTETCLENRDPRKHQRLLSVMQVSDYLMIESLRDLCCAFLASLVLQCGSEAEMLSLLGLAQTPTAAELEPLYDQYPFLR